MHCSGQNGAGEREIGACADSGVHETANQGAVAGVVARRKKCITVVGFGKISREWKRAGDGVKRGEIVFTQHLLKVGGLRDVESAGIAIYFPSDKRLKPAQELNFEAGRELLLEVVEKGLIVRGEGHVINNNNEYNIASIAGGEEIETRVDVGLTEVPT